ncbi:hypothetical protein BDZ91DRAFT_485953 [Kalaharituber pfeilii]|nr:hypothetical protein BDZ91DRAFT_485953 [Kalaharituber pfeilii]
MPIAQLNSGVKLGYRDSGKPDLTEADGCYETLVCVHGVMFNQEIFSPLFSAVPPGLRIITYNHRGYPGSSPLTPQELIDGALSRTTYLRDLISFLEYLNTNFSLPRKPVVLSWEKGGNILLGLASPSFLPKEMREKGIANASCLILHDCPGNGLGRVPTSDIVNAMIACPYPPLTSHSHYHKCHSQSQQQHEKQQYPEQPRNQPEYGSSTASSFSTSMDELDDFRTPTRSERQLSWICGFYKHHNHLPRDMPHAEPVYSSWAYKCSSELLPRTLIDLSLEIHNTPPNQSLSQHRIPQFPTNPHLWKLSDDRNHQIEFARIAIATQQDIPIALVWNGESPESTVDAAREAVRMGGQVYMLSETGNSLMFAHEPREWLVGVRTVAQKLVHPK